MDTHANAVASTNAIVAKPRVIAPLSIVPTRLLAQILARVPDLIRVAGQVLFARVFARIRSPRPNHRTHWRIEHNIPAAPLHCGAAAPDADNTAVTTRAPSARRIVIGLSLSYGLTI